MKDYVQKIIEGYRDDTDPNVEFVLAAINHFKKTGKFVFHGKMRVIDVESLLKSELFVLNIDKISDLYY